MRNLIDDDRYADVKVDLRRRMYEGLAASSGNHVIPYNERTNAGIVFRRRDGSPTAAFPERWLRHPESPDLMDGLLPDSPFEAQLKQAGKLPRLWTGPHERGGGKQGVQPESDSGA